MSRCPYPAQSVAGPGRRPDGSLAGLFAMGLDGENTWSCPAKVTEASARMFGGQLAGQSLAAAARTTPAGDVPDRDARGLPAPWRCFDACRVPRRTGP